MELNSLLYRFFLDPLSHGVACFLLAYVLAPTQFVKIVYQETNESYTAIIRRYLQARNFKVFFSGAHIYALRQFISASSFGFSQWLYLSSLRFCPVSHIVLLMIWQSFLVGVVETVITLYSETKEIEANKRELLKRKAEMKDIFTPLLIRNILAGSAPILAYEVTKNMEGWVANMVICALLAIAVSALTMPFDLIATQNCGSAVRMTWIGRLRQTIVVEKQFWSIFNGLAMRILQIVPYSIAHSVVMLLMGS
jgi:hypothetical protein